MDERLAKLRDVLDDIVASECVLCGEAMISTIDLPFISASDVSWT
jgi:hypothetical protein